jgi:O-antigen/teichoic acid export membrane protein
MIQIQVNFLANLAGSGWIVATGLICTPLYIRFMGMEAYGLIGFFLIMQGIVQILDLGLSTTMNREMARYSALPNKAEEARDFVRTLEVAYWAIGIAIGITVCSVAPYIATYWIKAGHLQAAEIRNAVMIMGVLAALQWPLSFYQGGLLGLQRQVLLNTISVSSTSLASFGAVLVLWRISPTVTSFFTWQIVVSLLQTLITTVALWRCLPAGNRPARFSPWLIWGIGGFAAGMSMITLSGLAMAQLDKIILSKLLDLRTFGYYTLASVVGTGLTLLIAPVFNTVFPQLSKMVAAGDEQGLRQMYHGASQVMAVLILPAAVVLSLFAREIMTFWTGSAEIALHTAPIVAILVAGTGLNGMLNLPYMLQLSHGWTRITLTINVVFLLAMVPTIFLMVKWYGAVGAAMFWLGLNAFHIFVGVPLTHRRILKGEAQLWFLKDFGLPLTVASVTALIGRLVLPRTMAPALEAASIGIIWLAAAVLTAFSVPIIRQWLLSMQWATLPWK